MLHVPTHSHSFSDVSSDQQASVILLSLIGLGPIMRPGLETVIPVSGWETKKYGQLLTGWITPLKYRSATVGVDGHRLEYTS